MTEIRTSKSHPLQIGEVFDGRIGITICPGKKTESMSGGFQWDRDLRTDLEQIKAWGGDKVVVIHFLEDKELQMLGVTDYQKMADELQIQLAPLPMPDRTIPTAAILRKWRMIKEHLYCFYFTKPNVKVLLHCNGGIGRSCVFAATMLIDNGNEPLVAASKVMSARRGSFDTKEQLAFVLNYRR